jgi:GT2 family glycosyltransferase
MTRPPLSDLVSIGITTRNRWQDLRVTLKRLAETGLGELPIHISDDGSDEPCPIPGSSIPLQLKLRRFSDSAGLIVRRNQLASDAKTKYLLSLDDDSYPISGSLEAAVQFAETDPDLLCVSFPIYNPNMGMHHTRSLTKEIYQVRSFTGCGHLMNLPHFWKVGGYREELVHQGEEIDLAARAFQEGFKCFHFPGFQIHHTASNRGRSWERMDYFGSRNNLLWNDWYVPRPIKFIQQTRTILAQTLLGLRVGRFALFKGQLDALLAIHQFRQFRRPFSMELYRLWKDLPVS